MTTEDILKDIISSSKDPIAITPEWLLAHGFLNHFDQVEFDPEAFIVNGGWKKWFFAKWTRPNYKPTIRRIHHPNFQIQYSERGCYMYDTYNYTKPMVYTWELALRYFSETGLDIRENIKT